MEKIQLDYGLKCYKLGEGTLCFNPADPNVYARFLEAADTFRAIEQELAGKECAQEALLQLLQDTDAKMKNTLNWVFGGKNDFSQMLGGVNLLAVAQNGERVITNLLTALEPVLLSGAKCCAQGKAMEALAKAQKRRDKGM